MRSHFITKGENAMGTYEIAILAALVLFVVFLVISVVAVVLLTIRWMTKNPSARICHGKTTRPTSPNI
jgi:hypothetical protein